MRPGTSIIRDDGEGVDHATAMNCKLEVQVDYVMATVVESAEGLQPMFEEAHKHLDWPKWEEAIQKELDLQKTGTY